MKKSLTLLTLFVFTFLTIGCSQSNNAKESFSEKKDIITEDITNSNEKKNTKEVVENIENTEDSKYTNQSNLEKKDEIIEDNKNIETYTYVLYRSDEQALSFVPEKIEKEISFTPYPKDKSTLEQTVLFLFEELKYTELEGTFPTVPNEVNLVGASIDGYNLTLIFDDSIYTYVQGSTGELMFIDSLVNTLDINLKDIEHIYLSLHDLPMETLNHLDVSDGLSVK